MKDEQQRILKKKSPIIMVVLAPNLSGKTRENGEYLRQDGGCHVVKSKRTHGLTSVLAYYCRKC